MSSSVMGFFSASSNSRISRALERMGIRYSRLIFCGDNPRLRLRGLYQFPYWKPMSIDRIRVHLIETWRLAHENDIEKSRPMDAFDAGHFNIRGCRGTGDESGRPGRVWPQAVEALRQRFDDLLCKE